MMITKAAEKIAAIRAARAASKAARQAAEQVARTNAGRVTIAEFLLNLGADEDTIRRFASSLGKKVADAYRAQAQQEPAQTGAALVNGKVRAVFAYTWNDLGLLIKVAADYAPTASLVNHAAA